MKELGFQRAQVLWNPGLFMHFNSLEKLYTIFIKLEKFETCEICRSRRFFTLAPQDIFYAILP